MRMPNKEDDVLLQTFQIGAGMSAQTKIEQNLLSRLSALGNAESYFELALFHCTLIPFLTNGQKQHKCLMDTIDWSTKSLEKNPDHWLALFLRSMVRLRMNDESDEMAMYLIPMDYTEEDAVSDQYKMIELQKSLTEPLPFCAVPYIQLAYERLIGDDAAGAVLILKEAEDNVKLEKIPYLANVLRLPFVTLYKKAYEMRNREILSILKHYMTALFPGEFFKSKGKD